MKNAEDILGPYLKFIEQPDLNHIYNVYVYQSPQIQIYTVAMVSTKEYKPKGDGKVEYQGRDHSYLRRELLFCTYQLQAEKININ